MSDRGGGVMDLEQKSVERSVAGAEASKFGSEMRQLHQSRAVAPQEGTAGLEHIFAPTTS